MNFSTNQVMQMFVLNGAETAEVKEIYTPDGTTVRGLVIKIKDEDDNVIDVTDIIDKKNILYTTIVGAENDKLQRKGLLVKLSGEVNEGAPIEGEEYVLTLTFRGFGEEDTYSKVVSAKATTDEPAKLLKKLAKALLDSVDVECSPLYELRLADGTLVTEETEITAEGFYIVEPIPHWSLGRFAETLMNIDVATAPIIIDGEEVNGWLANYKFVPATGVVAALPNSRRVADMEYFCKGERGTSNALVGWPDTPDYVAKVNPKAVNGYNILTVHYAYVGPNASNQKSEKDLIFVSEKSLEDLKNAILGIEVEPPAESTTEE